MKIKNILGALAALMLLVGCDNGGVDQPVDTTSSFTLSTTEISVGAEVAMQDVKYTITNPVNGAVVLSNCPASWVENLSTATYGSIKFTVAPNYTSETRSTQITVEYTAIKDTTFTISITQAASDVPMFAFQDVTADITSITLDITPADESTAYICRHYTKEYIDTFYLHDDSALIAHDMEAIAYEAGRAQQSLINYLYNISYVGVVSNVTFDQLTPDTDYVVYSYHVDLNSGNATSAVHREVIRTAKPTTDGATFTTTYDIVGATINQTITPSNEEIPYFVEYMAEEDFYSYYGSSANMAETFMSKWNENVTMRRNNGYSVSQIIEELCRKGTQTIEYDDLSAATNYVFYLFAVNTETAYVASDIIIDIIKTDDAQASGMTIDIKVENIFASSANIYWTASDPSGRFTRSVCTKAEFYNYGSTDEQRFAYFKANDISFFEVEGYTDMNCTTLSPNTEYIAFAYGLDGDTPNTKIFTTEFKTKSDTPGMSDIVMTWSEHYNMAEVAIADEEHWADNASKDNYALLPTTISGVSSGDTIYYMVTTLPLDWHSKDASWLMEVVQDKYLKNHYSHCNLVLEYEREYSIIAVALDANGNFGKLFKKSVCLKKEDSSDVSNYIFEEDK